MHTCPRSPAQTAARFPRMSVQGEPTRLDQTIESSGRRSGEITRITRQHETRRGKLSSEAAAATLILRSGDEGCMVLRLTGVVDACVILAACIGGGCTVQELSTTSSVFARGPRSFDLCLSRGYTVKGMSVLERTITRVRVSHRSMRYW